MFGINERFSSISQSQKEKIAVIYNEERLSYGAFAERVNSYDRKLAALGIGKGSRTAILFKNSSSMLALMLALLRRGACTSYLNFRENAAELAFALKLVDAKHLLCGDALADRAREAAALVENVSVISECELEAMAPGVSEATALDPGDIVVNFFTGGTTGRPKAASHSYSGLACQLDSCYALEAPVSGEDVFLNYAPLFHIGGFTAAMQTLCCGGTFVISDAFLAPELIRFVEKEQVTQMSLIPPSLCTELTACAGFRPEKLRSVKLLRMSGGACTVKNIKKVFELFPNTAVFIGYGMSERAVNTVQIIRRTDRIREIDGNISIGVPGAFNEYKLISEDGKAITAPFVPGEICGRGPCTMTGYYGRDNSFDAEGWFHTGDILYTDEDGYYYFIDRKKDMIKSGGENVYSNMIEQLLNAHPAVKECAVVGIPDERLGEMVAAAVVLNPGYTVLPEALMAYCGEKAAGYKKPRKIVFMQRLPRSKVGKVLKTEIRDILRNHD